MVRHTAVWKFVLGLVGLVVAAGIAIPLYRYADRDDAPGGMVIAFFIFVVGAVLAMWIVNPRRNPASPVQTDHYLESRVFRAAVRGRSL